MVLWRKCLEIVCGINNEKIQRRLLAETDLNFQKAIDLATALEQTEKGASDIQGQASSEGKVNVLKMRRKTVGVVVESIHQSTVTSKTLLFV